jgi:hypothetical protein
MPLQAKSDHQTMILQSQVNEEIAEWLSFEFVSSGFLNLNRLA